MVSFTYFLGELMISFPATAVQMSLVGIPAEVKKEQ